MESRGQSLNLLVSECCNSASDIRPPAPISVDVRSGRKAATRRKARRRRRRTSARKKGFVVYFRVRLSRNYYRLYLNGGITWLRTLVFGTCVRANMLCAWPSVITNCLPSSDLSFSLSELLHAAIIRHLRTYARPANGQRTARLHNNNARDYRILRTYT